jgi:protein involved in polysaccharide export with SLBB domain
MESINKITFIAILSLSINLFSQEIDAKFIESIPENIRKDLIQSYQNKQDGADAPSKEYNSFQSIVEANNDIDSYRNLERFGNSFFLNTPTTFMPINDPSANSGYILDVDDELMIQLIGDKADFIKSKINRSGQIPIKNIGMINIAGLSIDSANKLINKILEESFVDTEAIISLEKVRDIEILVTGQVSSPGIFILNGYSNILHALIMSGGISDYGSMRNIVLKRKNQAEKIVDLYDILVFGKTESNISLRSGDSIYVPSSQNFIPVMGGVPKEAIYEFKPGENVGNILAIVGGITKESSEKQLIISKKEGGMISSSEASSSDLVKKGDRLFVPYNDYHADFMMIDSSSQFIDMPVEILGAVKKPGNYFLAPGEKLSFLIEKAGGYLENANTFGGILINQEAKEREALFNKRLYDEAIKTMASISYGTKGIDVSNLLPILSEFKNTEASGRIVAEFDINKLAQDSEKDVVLTAGDKIFIPYNNNVVHIFGEVLNSGSVAYKKGFNIIDYIEASGGLNDSADKSRVILVKANGETKRIQLRKNLFMKINKDDEILPGSVIYISRDMRNIEGLDLALAFSPILSSLAVSLASINSINRN